MIEFLTTGRLSKKTAEISHGVRRVLSGLSDEPPAIDMDEVVQIKSALSLVKETLLKLPVVAKYVKKGLGSPSVQLNYAKRDFYRNKGEYPRLPHT